MIEYVSDPDVELMFFGGAIGADSLALRYCYEHRTGKRPLLVAVCPDTVWAQPAGAQLWIRKADDIVELKNDITPRDSYESYKIRNRYLVDQIAGDIGQLTAFWNGLQTSGTWNAVKYAKKVEACWEHVPVEGGKGR